MIGEVLQHHGLLASVADRLIHTPTTTDQLMLTRWRVLAICQHLTGSEQQHVEEACRSALEEFAANGPGFACDKALQNAAAAFASEEGSSQSVLPHLTRNKTAAVSAQLDALCDDGGLGIERALAILPMLRTQIVERVTGGLLPGILHRLDRVAAILKDENRPQQHRIRAAAAVLYVMEPEDVIPDGLGAVGLLDDDFALRLVLGEIESGQGALHLHWSERISCLRDDLPFLQGMRLQRNDTPIPISWLDRVNSFVAYSHVLERQKSILVLLQPSVSCSPLHPIVSLIGLLVLDSMTSCENVVASLREGQTYCLDGYVVTYQGVAKEPLLAGWLRLGFRQNKISYCPPNLAGELLPIAPRALSDARKFHATRPVADPLQQFFGWSAAIGPGSIASHAALVTSHQRARELFDGVQSNGVNLQDQGLIRFVSDAPQDVDVHGSVVLVIPSLGTARRLLDRGLHLQVVFVDGYERLQRGRLELPFLMSRKDAPPVVVWSPTGYYPARPPSWMPDHRHLEVSPEDLAGILDLDNSDTGPSESLWEAATGLAVQPRISPTSPSEMAVASAIDSYLGLVRTSEHLPEYWQYYLTGLARVLRLLVASTPAEWVEIRRFAEAWSVSVDQKWSCLRTSAQLALAGLRDAERRVLEALRGVPDRYNSRSAALAAFLSETGQPPKERWYFACDRPEQEVTVASLIRSMGLRGVEPVLVRNLGVCRSCLVAGWVSRSFARRLWSHTPRTLVALVDELDAEQWQRSAELRKLPIGRPLLEALGGVEFTPWPSCLAESAWEPPEPMRQHAQENGDGAEHVPCVFLWLTGETDAKVLAPNARIVVEDGQQVRERTASNLRDGDRILLGLGTDGSSPADQFTEAVVAAVKESNPDIVLSAREWRRALGEYQAAYRLSASQVRTRLANVGIERQEITIHGWLDLERASPIAPRGLQRELSTLWPILGDHARQPLDSVISSCARLRALRASAGRALLQLWQGRRVNLGLGGAGLESLAEKVRHEVQVFEVNSVAFGEAPRAMMGWWVSPHVVSQYESQSGQWAVEAEGEDELASD